MAGGGVIARGVAVYSAEEVRQIAGRRASEIEKILGYTYADEVVHRSDLVLTQRLAGQGGREG
jgi:glutamate 5-kinase